MRLSILLAALVLVAGCDTGGVETTSSIALYVGNQGNFSDNNGSVTRYDPETGEVVQDAIPNLGGLVQNLYGGANTLFVLLNFDDSFTTGRGRVDIYDTVGRERVRQIGVRTPRALAGRVFTGLGASEVYVTNLYDNTVTPVNLVSGAAGAPIPVGGEFPETNPEGVVSVAGRTYVANSGFGQGTTLTVLDTGAGAVVGTVEDVCVGPRTLLVDDQREVWVICTGTSDFATGAVTAPGQVVVLDGATGEVRARYVAEGETLGSATLGVDGVFVRTGPDALGQEVYVIADGAVLRFNARENALDARIAVPGAPVGAVAYETVADRLYLGRPDAQNPFTADGAVTIHDRTGAQVGSFRAGIAPSVMAFASEERTVEG